MFTDAPRRRADALSSPAPSADPDAQFELRARATPPDRRERELEQTALALRGHRPTNCNRRPRNAHDRSSRSDHRPASRLAVDAPLAGHRSSARPHPVRRLRADTRPRRRQHQGSRPSCRAARCARAVAASLRRREGAACCRRAAGSRRAARRRLPDAPPGGDGRRPALAPPASPDGLPVRPHRHCSPPARSRSSASSRTRPRRRGWPESALPTPSRTATSTSTTGSSARSTTRTRPSRACTSVTR